MSISAYRFDRTSGLARDSRLQPEVARRSSDWRDTSKWITQFRQANFQRVEDVIRSDNLRSGTKRKRRNPPFVQAYAREMGPHYDNAVLRSWTGDQSTAEILTRYYAALGIDSIFAELTSRVLTQNTALCVCVPIEDDGEMQLRLVLLDPWEAEVDPHPFAPQSVSQASQIRLRLPRLATHDEIQFDVAVLDRSTNRGTWKSDNRGIWSMDGTLPLGRYPVAVARIGDTIPGDFFCPLPVWLYEAQLGLSQHKSELEFRGRYSAGQLVGYGIESELAQQMDWGPDGIASTSATKDDTTIEHISRDFDAKGFIAIGDDFTDSVRLNAGLRPQQTGTTAVTAEAKMVEYFDREQARKRITLALQSAERSVAAMMRTMVGWNFGAGTEPLPAAVPVVEYVVPKPPQNPLQAAQANRMRYEDGKSTPGYDLAMERGLTPEEGEAQALQNVRLYAAIRGELSGNSTPL